MGNYGTRVLAERSGRRMSQARLAEALGITVPTLVDIEYDRIGIDDETLERALTVIQNFEPIEDQAAA